MTDQDQDHSIVGPSWNLYWYTYTEGLQAVISFDVQLAREETHQGLDKAARVIVYVPPQQVMENGLPIGEILPRLTALEERLIAALEEQQVTCRFAGRMTYGGMREFAFQVQDLSPFRECVTGLAQETNDYEIELIESDGWQFFDEKIRPSPVFWQQISDREVIQQLVNAGSDPDAVHVLDHTFLGEPHQLERLKQELGANGFIATYHQGDTLTMSRKSRLDLEEIFDLTSRLYSCCQSLGVTYDGWGAAVVRS